MAPALTFRCPPPPMQPIMGRNFYRRPPKLWECNVFSRVCLSTWGPTIQDPRPPISTKLQRPQTCSYLFRLDLMVPRPSLRPQTCSNFFIMNHVRPASERLASYWNAFFLQLFLKNKNAFQWDAYHPQQ